MLEFTLEDDAPLLPARGWLVLLMLPNVFPARATLGAWLLALVALIGCLARAAARD